VQQLEYLDLAVRTLGIQHGLKGAPELLNGHRYEMSCDVSRVSVMYMYVYMGDVCKHVSV
jgi:hypothetical protein